MIPAPATLERRLRHRRGLAFLALLFERIWVALWPPLGVCGLFVCLALLGLPQVLPPAGQCAFLGVFALAAAVLLWRGFAGLRAPAPPEVDRRLEHDSGFAHRPLAVLSDRPVAADAFGAALWDLHFYRSAAQLARLRVRRPRPGLARADRHALRGALVVALAACIGIAGTDAPRRVWAALTPSLPRAVAAPATELQAWITPPAYTGLAPIFLKSGADDAAPLRVPTGSRLVVSVTGGGDGRPSLDLGGRHASFTALSAGSFQAGLALTKSGVLHVRRAGDSLARWRIDVLPDLPPKAVWAGKPGPARAQLHTALPWRASDDYGVTKLVAELRLKARPKAPPIVVPIPVAGTGKEAHGIAEPDLSANPWAGLPVTARLVAHDAIGQQGISADAAFTLPERHFRNPEARKLIAIRKGLSLRPDDRDAALAGLDALLVQPGSIGKDPSAYVNLAGIYYLLEFDHAPAAVPQAQRRIWQLALRLEEGAAARSDQALQNAMRAAQDALSAMKAAPDAAHRRALEQKLQALEDAIRRHMQALARQYQNQGLPPAAQFPNARRLDQKTLEAMAQRALEAARHGKPQQAEQALAQLRQMLDAMRQAHPMTAQDRAREKARRQARQQMSVMQDLLNREGGILNHTQERRQEAARAGAMHTPAPDQSAGQAHDAAVQKALRRALGEVMEQVGELTGKVPGSLGAADQAMERAAKALGAGKDTPAQAAELKAIQNLQKGGRQAAQQMAQKFGQGQNGQGGQGGGAMLTQGNGEGEGFAPDQGTFGQEGGQRGLDPLGRRTGEGGSGWDEGNDVKVPERAGPKRTEAIEQELRRRDADRARPQMERQYIQRLLKQF